MRVLVIVVLFIVATSFRVSYIHNVLMAAGTCVAPSMDVWAELQENQWDTWVMTKVDAVCVHPWFFLSMSFPLPVATIGEAWIGSASRMAEAHVAGRGRDARDVAAIVVHEAAHLWGYRLRGSTCNEEFAQLIMDQFKAGSAPPLMVTHDDCEK